MHIIFGQISHWHIPVMIILRYLGLKIFYLYIESKTDLKKKRVANQLKKKNIIPMPIEFEKNISPKEYFSLMGPDFDEVSYKKNVKMIPDKILKKYCNLFSIEENDVNKLRLLIQDIIGNQQLLYSSKLEMWANLHSSKKIIFINFKIKGVFVPSVNRNIIKITIPLDIFKYLAIFIKNFFLSLFRFKNQGQNIQNLNNQNFNELVEKKIAFVVHKGLFYGASNKKLFDKSLYYSENKNSLLNKYNILHLDYSNYPNPEKNIHWVKIFYTQLL